MHESLVAVCIQLALDAADLPAGQAEQSCRLGLRAFPALHAVHDLEDVTFLLAHRNPVVAMHVDSHGSSLPESRRTMLSRYARPDISIGVRPDISIVVRQ